MAKEVLVTVRANLLRRILAVVMLLMLSAFLTSVAFGAELTSVVARAVCALVAIACLAMAFRLWQATEGGVELTRSGLRDTRGVELARLEQIVKVERGAFAFKPTNGLTVRLNTPLETGWAPGLWWRYGTRLGIGGITNAGQGKAMAEMLTVLIDDPSGLDYRLEDPD